MTKALCSFQASGTTHPVTKALCSFQASGTTHPVMQRYISEDHSPQHWSVVYCTCLKSFVSLNYHHHHWLDSPWWALAFLRSLTHSSLLRATFFQFLTPSTLISWSTPSSHRNFGLPTLLAPSGFGVEYLFKHSVVVHTHQVPCPCQSFNFHIINNLYIRMTVHLWIVN